MTKRTKLFIFIAVDTVILLIIAAFIFLMIFLGDIIKTGVNTFLPEITGTKSGIEKCSVKLLRGRIEIENFIIGNPEGYKSPYAFKLGNFSVEVNISSLFSNTIEIKDIYISNMEISYETNLSESNIGRIQKNIQVFIKSQKSSDTSQTDAASKPEKKSKGPGKKFIIGKLVFKGSRLKAGVHILDADINSAISLPPVELHDIGKKSAGVTAAELANQIIGDLYKAVLEAVKKNDKGIMGNIKKQGKKLMNFFK